MSESLQSFLSLVFSALVILYLIGDILHTCRGNIKIFSKLTRSFLWFIYVPRVLWLPVMRKTWPAPWDFLNITLSDTEGGLLSIMRSLYNVLRARGKRQLPSRHFPNHILPGFLGFRHNGSNHANSEVLKTVSAWTLTYASCQGNHWGTRQVSEGNCLQFWRHI